MEKGTGTGTIEAEFWQTDPSEKLSGLKALGFVARVKPPLPTYYYPLVGRVGKTEDEVDVLSVGRQPCRMTS